MKRIENVACVIADVPAVRTKCNHRIGEFLTPSPEQPRGPASEEVRSQTTTNPEIPSDGDRQNPRAGGSGRFRKENSSSPRKAEFRRDERDSAFRELRTGAESATCDLQRTKSGRHGIRTHIPITGARISSAARQTVSGYLPLGGVSLAASKWTHRELNPNLRHARAVSSHWTMSPIVVERSTRELNPVFRPTKAACCPETPADQWQSMGCLFFAAFVNDREEMVTAEN